MRDDDDLEPSPFPLRKTSDPIHKSCASEEREVKLGLVYQNT